MMLRIEEYRNEFVQCEGVPSILAALDGRTNFQLQYQLIFCLWQENIFLINILLKSRPQN